MADLTTYAKTAVALCGGMPRGKSNRVNKDGSLRTQFFQNETQAYTQEMGIYASNVYAADCQGLNPDDFYNWSRIKIRSIRAAQAQTGETMPDDWQRIYIIDPARYTYIPQGAMLKYADNTWVVYKGKNMEAILGAAIVRRCNAVINVLDWYGNIVTVPMSYSKMGTLGNAPHTTENTITSKNYIACICQLNEHSRQFHENTRIILGDTAYAMRGMDDFTREFTDDPDSVHLLTFTIERVEVQPFDNIELGVADYGGFSWELHVDWNNSMRTGMTQALNVTSRRNNVPVEDGEEHAISYLYESSDESILTVDENGNVTAVGEGEAEITISLAQNPGIKQTVHIEVPAAENEYVAFTTTLPKTLHEGESIEIGAAFFQNGLSTNFPITITFSGVEAGVIGFNRVYASESMALSNTVYSGEAYSEVIDADSRVKLNVYHASQRPLTITAEYNGYSATEEVWLVT